MTNFICSTCGVQYEATEGAPADCRICEDERQYVPPDGQQWTTLDELQASHHNVIKEQEPGLLGIAAEPKFAIGQRALLVPSPNGNVLWDCISLVDDATVEAIQKQGGIAAIAISHPHFYSSMIEWSRAFGDVPIYLHAADREWVMRPDPAIHYWEGETHQLAEGLTLIHCGGHFPGSTVLHWQAGAQGNGVFLVGDTIYTAADHRYVSFMYSYPNLIPLAASAIQSIAAAVAPFAFARLYDGWCTGVVPSEAKQAVERSAARYIRHIRKA
jgi:glyoxylase-like metal-dependent hydrolase (beta-lactamase superfamily II)